MYENFFEMRNTPFVRNVPTDRLYRSPQIEDAMGRLRYAADHKKFATVMAEPGCGKSTLIRMFVNSLPRDKYLALYLSDSKLTPRWLYSGLLNQLGLEPRFYRGDSKNDLNKELETIWAVQGRKVVCILDEAHLLEKETLEEFRFLLNTEYDSESNLSLILVGQKELWEKKLRLQTYAAIRQRIDISIILGRLDRSEVSKYIRSHLDYAGYTGELFTSDAEDEIYRVSGGIPRMVNRICEKALMYAYQQQKRMIDGHMVTYVADHEMLQTEAGSM
ncbi:MAG: AAA family ATPase [Lachnospiraceae bacterium]|nr:AAA family ATPase [Lachnospiraceae bacterium]